MQSLLMRYQKAVFSGFETILEQIDLIIKAGRLIADTKTTGGRWMLYDRGYALSLDTWTRGSNPCDNHIYRYSKKSFKHGDCLVLGSYSADNPDDVSVVGELREKSNTNLITICPHKIPDNPRSDRLLYTFADVAIDNGTDNHAGAFDVPSIIGGILPYARDINLIILQAVAAEYMQTMISYGKPPTQFYMVHFPYFREIQELMNQRKEKYGY
ncbi:MAG: hypothetical protein HOC71_13175 [Candidatus Latescibacteria bacterium]|nr:hypothetical protein [Candidatus Latescibacterota bacterium]